jgi:membrane-associated phospholipid phosphatase
VYALATGVAASRVHLGHHFPSDVIAGGVAGIGCGMVVAAVLKQPKAI